MTEVLTRLDRGLPRNGTVRIDPRRHHPIIVSPLDAQPEPPNLEALKDELSRRWPMTGLLDILKETDLRIDYTEAFATAAAREAIDRDEVRRRLLLCLYGLGTNAGCSQHRPRPGRRAARRRISMHGPKALQNAYQRRMAAPAAEPQQLAEQLAAIAPPLSLPGLRRHGRERRKKWRVGEMDFAAAERKFGVNELPRREFDLLGIDQRPFAVDQPHHRQIGRHPDRQRAHLALEPDHNGGVARRHPNDFRQCDAERQQFGHRVLQAVGAREGRRPFVIGDERVGASLNMPR